MFVGPSVYEAKKLDKIMKCSAFWGTTQRSLLFISLRFKFPIRFHFGLSLGSFFGHENGGNIFLGNDDRLSTDYVILYPKRQNVHKHHYMDLKSYKNIASSDN
jgi:hypothetical protein